MADAPPPLDQATCEIKIYLESCPHPVTRQPRDVAGQAGDILDGIQWLRREVDGNYVEFVWKPVMVNASRKVFTVGHYLREQINMYFLQVTDQRLSLVIPQRLSGILPQGTMVTPRIQIMLGSAPHPQPYARLPSVPLTSDWQKIQQIGIGLSYEVEGTKRTVFIQSEQATLSDATVPESWTAYVQMHALKNYFEQQSCPNNHAWMPNYGRAHITDLIFDRPNRLLQARRRFFKDHATTILPPILLGQADKHRALSIAGCSNVGNTAPPPELPQQMCDRCYIIQKYLGQAAPCERSPGEFCADCKRMGWLCSWSPHRHLDSLEPEGIRIRDALHGHWRPIEDFVHIVPPGLMSEADNLFWNGVRCWRPMQPGTFG